VIANIIMGRTAFKDSILEELGYKKRETMYDPVTKNGEVK